MIHFITYHYKGMKNNDKYFHFKGVKEEREESANDRKKRLPDLIK